MPCSASQALALGLLGEFERVLDRVMQLRRGSVEQMRGCLAECDFPLAQLLVGGVRGVQT